MSSCREKKSWRKRSRAKRAAQLARSTAGKPLYAYRCPDCRLYHLTSRAPDWRFTAMLRERKEA